MKLKVENLKEYSEWEKMEVALPLFDVENMVKNTKETPTWVHFGAGNIFRGFIASLQQRLLNNKSADTGIIAVESFDHEVIKKVYEPYDNLTMNVTLHNNGSTTREIVASVAEGICSDELSRLRWIFEQDSLQMVSFTVTEKAYNLKDAAGNYLPVIEQDFKTGMGGPKHVVAVVASLLHSRFLSGGKPIALVSMDNCSENGKKLRSAVLEMVKAWVKEGYAREGFLTYVKSQRKVAFPWTMIDKITPRPSDSIADSLDMVGVEDMGCITTEKGSYMAPFVNAERAQYLVIEDRFPNGRPKLEEAGVYFCKRAVVNQVETMKVTTCLNPLHTAMSLYGCLLGYSSISEEMNDPRIQKLVDKLGYVEGLPVVIDPEIIEPKAFLDEVITQRLTNPFLPDSPQRIACDTSQKMAIRFGETLKSYVKKGKNLEDLLAIPLSIAGWFRYLLAVDDNLQKMECSPDPMLEELQAQLKGITVGKVDSYQGQLLPLLKNKQLFGVDLVEIGLSDKIETMFKEQLSGAGGVNNTLTHYLK